MLSHLKRRSKSAVTLALRAIIFLLLCSVGPTLAQEDRHPSRGFHPGKSYALSDIEAISMANGNLSINIPLGSLPGGRGGSDGFTFSLSYNSKSYDTHIDEVPNELGQNENRTHLNFAEDEGWHYTQLGFERRTLSRLNEEPGVPCIPGSVSPFEYQRNSFIWKVQIIYPDGAAHEFRPVGFNDQFADGFFNVSPNGWLFQDSISSTGGGCSHNEVLATTGPMVYYSIDGSYTRLVVEHDFNLANRSGFGNAWTLYFPDGRRVVHQPGQPQRNFDRNNRFFTVQAITHNGNPASQIVDELGRGIILEVHQQNGSFPGSLIREDFVFVKGVNGEEMRWTIRWKQIYICKQYRATVEQGGIGRGNTYITPWEGVLQVVDKITMPTQAGGLTYEFGYNAGDYVGDTQVPSFGWGELNSIKLPSGAKASYTYGLDGSTVTPNWRSVLKNRPGRKELRYRQEHDLASINNTPCDPQVETCTTEVWTYGAQTMANNMIANTATITTPDGGVTTETIEDNPFNPFLGLTRVSVLPDGTKVENLWRENRAPGMNGQKVNPFLKTVFTSIKPAAGGDYVKTSIKDYNYDKNGNVTRVAEYDWVPYLSVPRDSISGLPTGVPGGVSPKRVTVSAYFNATPDASDTTTDDPDTYHRITAPQLLAAVKSSEIGTGAPTPLSRTEYFYDSSTTTGNLTEQRTWDSQKGAYTNPLTPSNSISVVNQYDPNVLGKLTQTTNPRGFRTEFDYGLINGVADLYPTEIRVAAGTTVQRIERRDYDFDTGLVTRATDVDNNVATATTYDVLGRPTLVKAAEGKPEESRTATEYSDLNRRVIVRSDLNTVGDGKLVSIQHYDQLGRIRLSRQLEDAAQSATDESTGIKVQTRYKFNGANSHILVSNPYRAATSNAANGESTMGWAVTTNDRSGRVIRSETFAGAGLPAPWDTNSATTGAVITVHDLETTTVTDQAGKTRKSITDGLGRLAQVIEAPGVVNFDFQTSYEYDALANLKQVTQGIQTRTYNYSSLSRLTSAINPESGTITYQYDNHGNLTQRTDSRSPAVTTTCVYDPLDRLTTRSYSDGTPTVTYSYDTVPNSKGRITGVSSSVSSYSYTSYDPLGRILTSKQTTDGQEYIMNYQYNLAGSMKSQSYPSGRTVVTEFDNAGRIAGVKNQSSGTFYVGAAATDSTNRIQYSVHGATSQLKLGNALWEHTNFNSRLQATQIGLGTASTNSSVLQMDYGYGTTTNNGNLLDHTIAIPGLTLSQAYTYDALNRLETANENAGSSWKQKYVYDRYGNRRIDTNSANTSPDLVGPNPVLSEANNRIVAQPGEQYDYDGAGNLTKGRDGQNYGFDAENKMKSFNGGATQGGADYLYDGRGKRVKKVVGSASTVFVYDVKGQLVAEYSSAAPEMNGTRYLTNDYLGSPRVVTDTSGTVKARHDYHPFGEEVGLKGGRNADPHKYVSDSVRQKFTSKERDSETGLDFFGERYYASTHGRFTSVDPLMASASTRDPQSFNRFVFVLNNPLRYVDPDGLKERTPWDQLTKQERRIIAKKIVVKKGQTVKQAFNAMATVKDAKGKVDRQATADKVTTIKNFIDSAGGHTNSPVWQQIQNINSIDIQKNPSDPSKNEGRVTVSVANKDEFTKVLGENGYDVNARYEIFSDHKNDSARQQTRTSFEPGMHFANDDDTNLNKFYVHWDRRSTAFKESSDKYWTRLGEQYEASQTHQNPYSPSELRQELKKNGTVPKGEP